MLWVGFGGMIGAILRYLATGELNGLALWVVNGAGSFSLGYLTGRLISSSKWKQFLGTGMIGSFTTFSAFSAEWFAWLEQDLLIGILYGAGMTVLCYNLCWVGVKVGKLERGKV